MKLTEKIAKLICEEDIGQYVVGEGTKLLTALLMDDHLSAIENAADLGRTALYYPSILFWEKVSRFLRNTFHDYEEQVKFASRFNRENGEYANNVKTMLDIVSRMETDGKIDYFANLTRCMFLMEMDISLYYRLVKLIENCTVYELDYIHALNLEEKLENKGLVSMLIIQGLVVQGSPEENKVYYKLSPYGVLLKKCSLNFEDDNLSIKNMDLRYDRVDQITQTEPLTKEDMDEIKNAFHINPF